MMEIQKSSGCVFADLGLKRPSSAMDDIGWATVLREVADSHPDLKDGLHGAADHFERMETEIANLQAEVDAWRDRFKGAGFDGKRIVMCG